MNLFLFIVINFIILIIPILLTVAFLTLCERKILASIQRRKGPKVVGFLGLLQPLADGLKLFLKEVIIPLQANYFVFLGAPLLTLMISLFVWGIIPFSLGIVLSDINLGLLYIFAVSSLNVYGIIFAGWSSNSKYAFLGALRSAAQMISYEVSIGLIIINIALFTKSLNLTNIVLSQENCWFVFSHFPIFMMFFVSSLAETNRPPFDLPEAEAELVAGYNVEYSAISFAFFFIGEYANIILMSFINVLLFFGGWFPLFDNNSFFPNFVYLIFKVLFFLFLFVLVRAVLPRYRYDQLMQIGWKFLLPISLSFILFYSGYLFCFENVLTNFCKMGV